METKQETKSLPRNRKCGNCRYFEPAPLWRKGWCRNPRLYDRRANHLVDAATIDCEQVFRARIYWEPVPTAEVINQEPVVYTNYKENRNGELFADQITADGGEQVRKNKDGVLRAVSKQPARPVINRREKAAATPNLVAKQSQTRKWLLDNIPYYDRVDGPARRIGLGSWLPWVLISLLVLLLLLNLNNGKDGKNSAVLTPNSNTTASTQADPSSASGTPVLSAPGPTGQGQNLAGSGAKPTATLSSSLPTATVLASTAAAQTKTLAKVVGTNGKGLNLRKEPHSTTSKEPDNTITRIPDGQEVEITGGLKNADGIEWWPVSYKGQTGWAAKEYLQKVDPTPR